MTLTFFIGVLAACGMLLIIWTVLEAFLLPMPKDKAYIVLYLSGDAGKVERYIRSCLWLMERRGFGARLILVDDGLSPDAQSAAELLLRGEDHAVLCSKTQMREYLETEN
ncbi:MAG: hypothetical protein LBM28_05600 [Oscillospiraceae bacterium]|jgi:hypothetical protein|nr:hypothetical protein [Oscillospiraceae bacterium]